MDQATTVVLVDVERNLFPPQIRSLIATALHAKGTRVAEDGISLRKLRWTLGNPRLPAWACSCEHVSGFIGATVSYTGGRFVTRSADDWTSGYTAWRRNGPATKGPGPPSAVPPPPQPRGYPRPAGWTTAVPFVLLSCCLSPPTCVLPCCSCPSSAYKPSRLCTYWTGVGGWASNSFPDRGPRAANAQRPAAGCFRGLSDTFGVCLPTAETLQQHNWLQSLKSSGARFRLDV